VYTRIHEIGSVARALVSHGPLCVDEMFFCVNYTVPCVLTTPRRVLAEKTAWLSRGVQGIRAASAGKRLEIGARGIGAVPGCR